MKHHFYFFGREENLLMRIRILFLNQSFATKMNVEL